MTDHDHADRLMRDLDAVIRGDAPSDTHPLLDTARTLLDADFNAEASLALLRPAAMTKGHPKMSRLYRTLRALTATAAVLTLIAITILTVPPLRAIAQDILRRIGMYNITNAPTSRDLMMMPLPALQMAEGGSHLWTFTQETIENNHSWLAVLDMPAGFDTAEYALESLPEFAVSYASAKYTRGGDLSTELEFNQMQRYFGNELDFVTGGAQTESVEVNGRLGYWVAGFTDAPGVDIQMLIWTGQLYNRPNGLLMWLTGRGKTKEEMIEIARAVIVRDPLDIQQPVSVTMDIQRDSTLPPSQVAAELGFDVSRRTGRPA